MKSFRGPGACTQCRYYELGLHEDPCEWCFKSMVHPAWKPVDNPEKMKHGRYSIMEGKGCENCRWRYAPTNTPPCSKCDGFELDKWELHEWPKPGEDPGDDPETYVDQVLAEAEERDKSVLYAAQTAVAHMIPQESPGKVRGDAIRRILEKAVAPETPGKIEEGTIEMAPLPNLKEAMKKMKGECGKPVYQQRIEERVAAQVAKGREKYGVTLEDNVTLTEAQRIEHLEEELIDGLMYCEHLAAVGRERGITADDYQRAALRTAQADRLSADELLLNGVMGLCGEAGECIDIVKKARFQGHELNAEKLAEELGDVAWYLAVAAHGLGIPLSAILEGNVEKLMKRYPGGFDKARSMNRAGEGAE